ncbi:hypothetical protein MUG84_17475 [Paenibacillus sp. KQZ6P-2]|uniref:Uncharacterized protein n=1 Tax=Paenibacillus mangrovi TaxID=2931978 RepID=A0A9X1WTU3_9BACL|nr:hypothetical protein [Paenibacillus mangrovi]MCJ8013520.1 hypothetical protein [Paenibacillus mangrovi]
MEKLISARLSGNILVISLVLLVIFHILILLRIVPYETVWGGQIVDSSSLMILECIALFLTIMFILVISIKIGYIKTKRFMKANNIGIWIMFGYFSLNTIGNFASVVSVEKMILAPITILMTLLAFRLALEK